MKATSQKRVVRTKLDTCSTQGFKQ